MPGKPLTTRSRVTVRGYTFLTRLIERREVIFIDPQRKNKEVLRASVPEEARKWSAALDNFQKKVARMILDEYENQHLRVARKIMLMPDIQLTATELKSRIGFQSGRLAQSIDGEFRGAAARKENIADESE